jgi:uncharacterized protein YwgA
MDTLMRRADWLLLLLSDRTLDPDGSTTLDPVRIQKGMFLLSKRGPHKQLYDFQPYNWGPFSRDVYSDLDQLVAQGLVEQESRPGQSWSLYKLSEDGYMLASKVASSTDENAVRWMAQLRRYLTSRSFNELLTEIYSLHPEYATRSQFASQ